MNELIMVKRIIAHYEGTGAVPGITLEHFTWN